MPHFSTLHLFRARSAVLAAALATAATLAAFPARAAGEDPLKSEAVTVIKATKACFADIVEVSGTVSAGQTIARLNLPEGGIANVTAPVSGVISASTAVIGAMASGKGEALFTIIARGEYDLIGLVPSEDLGKLQVNQPSSITVIGTGMVDGNVRRVAPTVEPNSQLGQVFIGITRNNTGRKLLVNASGRALIKTGQSCGVAVPLTAVQYSSAGTVVQVVRRERIETKRVETGLISGGAIEIREGLNDGDDVVARAGALLREGDPVRPMQEKVSQSGK